MIRTPTRLGVLLNWHKGALNGYDDRIDGEPQCGWYKRKIVRGGPWVPVRIWMHQALDPMTGELTEPEELRAASLGEPVDPYRVWLMLRPISREDYDALARLHHDNPMMAKIDTAIDLTTTPIGPARTIT